MSDDPAQKTHRFLQLLSNVEEQASEMETLGQGIARAARLTRDLVSPLRDLMSELPTDALPPGELDRQIQTWDAWSSTADVLRGSSATANAFIAVSLGASTAVSGVVTVAIPPPTLPDPVRGRINGAREKISRTLGLFPLAEEARTSMRRLGLDRKVGNHQTPLELLDAAQAALDRPALGGGSPVSILIPLRECINGVVSELVRRRPNQEPAAKLPDKLSSVGRQCARSGLLDAHFQRLGVDGARLMDELSGAKQADLDRDQLINTFNRGLSFLAALLNSIDETQLRAA